MELKILDKKYDVIHWHSTPVILKAVKICNYHTYVTPTMLLGAQLAGAGWCYYIEAVLLP